MENILYFDVHVPFWTSFKIGGTVNYQPTYPIPPFTTLYGLIANALGLEQDDYSLREYIKLSLKTLNEGELIEDYTNVAKPEPAGKKVVDFKKKKDEFEGLKLYLSKPNSNLTESEKLKIEKYMQMISDISEKGWVSEENIHKLIEKLYQDAEENKKDFHYVYTTHVKPFMAKTQVIRQRIIKPAFRVYLKIKTTDVNVGNDKKNLAMWIKESLENPNRPLYLGQSDDMIVIEQISDLKDIEEVNRKFVNKIDSIIPTAIEKHEIILLPLSFEKKGSNYEKKHGTFTYRHDGIKLKENVEAFVIGGDYVVFEDFQPYKS